MEDPRSARGQARPYKHMGSFRLCYLHNPCDPSQSHGQAQHQWGMEMHSASAVVANMKVLGCNSNNKERVKNWKQQSSLPQVETVWGIKHSRVGPRAEDLQISDVRNHST